MIIFIFMGIAFIIFITWGILDLFENKGTNWWYASNICKDLVSKIFAGLGISILVGTAIGFLVIISTCIFEPKQKVEMIDSKTIHAIVNDEKIQNSYIGRAIINKELKYIYVTDGPQGLQLKTQEVEHTYIKQDNSISPHVEIWRRVYSNKICTWLFLIKDFNDGKDMVFYIPEGSLVSMTDYTVELK